MSAADRNASSSSLWESFGPAAALARKLVFCTVLIICFSAADMRCSNPPGGEPSLWNCSCTWIVRANADDKEDEAEKKAKEQAKKEEERAREQAKKDAERAREQAKKDEERAREQAKKDEEREKERGKQEDEQQRELAKQDQERQREQEKKALERQFEQSKKTLEESGASEEEKKELKERFEREKQTLEASRRVSRKRPPATLVEFFKRTFKPRAKKRDDDEEDPVRRAKKPKDGDRDDEQKSRRRIEKAKDDDDDEEQRRAEKPKDDEPDPTRPKPAKKPSRRVADRPSIPRTSFRTNEVLAVNPGARGRRAAQKLGLRVISSTDISGVRGRVVRYATPPGVDARKARQLLRREVPNGRFALNKKYRVYHAAREAAGPVKPGAVKPTPSRRNRSRAGRKARSAKYACEADHCFSRSVLQWKPELASCSGGVRIGIIDTNVDVTHRTFQGQRIRVGNFIPSEQRSSSDSHGTAVASILAGSPNSATPGLVPGAEFFTANIFYSDGNGQPATDTLALLQALDWLEAWDVQLVNMSFVGPEDQLIQDALRRMTRKHTVFVAATGNEGPTAPPRYPAAYPEVIAVTAVNRKLRNYWRANRGPFVDVAAPGVNIWTALPGNREGYQSGTSFATPHVTALLATIYKSHANERTRDQLIKYLPIQDLGSQGRDPIYGRGLVMAPTDCRGAIRQPAVVARAAASAPNKGAFAPVAPASAALSWKPVLLRDRAAPRNALSLNRR